MRSERMLVINDPYLGLPKRPNCSLCGDTDGWVCQLCSRDAKPGESHEYAYAVDRLWAITMRDKNR